MSSSLFSLFLFYLLYFFFPHPLLFGVALFYSLVVLIGMKVTLTDDGGSNRMLGPRSVATSSSREVRIKHEGGN